jgi:hypothetical protein
MLRILPQSMISEESRRRQHAIVTMLPVSPHCAYLATICPDLSSRVACATPRRWTFTHADAYLPG